MFCFTLGSDWVYQYSRLTFEVGALLEDPAIYSAFSIRWFQWCILICIWCIVLLFCCKLWCILYIHIVASWTTISFISAALITLCLWSVIILFTVYVQFCQFKLTTRYFEQFNSGMSVYLYTYNGCEWSKISGHYTNCNDPLFWTIQIDNKSTHVRIE